MTDYSIFTPTYFAKGAFAGGLCCSITHGMVSGFRQVIAEEGVGALATGLGPTASGYFVQGFFKFGGVELGKVTMSK
eukprot:Pgem_evm1s18956